MIELPISCSLHALNGGYVVSVPTWDDGEQVMDFHTFGTLGNALRFIRRTIEELDAQEKSADDAEPASVEDSQDD